jgi:glutathione S-transferase
LKLLYSPTSPYARKVIVAAHEIGRIGEIELVQEPTNVLAPPEAIRRHNPLGKIPTLVTDDGTALYDSRVICEYLDAGNTRTRLFPQGNDRWAALTLQALGEGVMDAAWLLRNEVIRPEAFRYPAWMEGMKTKIMSGVDSMEAQAHALSAMTIGSVSCACALGYLDFRFDDLGWRQGHAQLAAWYEACAARPSMQSTRP